MEITGSPELLVYRLVGCELTPDSTVVEVRGRRIGDGFFGLIAGPDEIGRIVALMGKTVG